MMHSPIDSHLQLVAETYDAAIDPGRWQGYLDQLADLLGGKIATLVVMDPLDERFSLSFSSSLLSEEAKREYLETVGRYEADDFQALAAQPRSQLVRDVDFYGMERLKAHPVSHWMLERFGTFHRTAGILNSHNGWIDLFAVQFDRDREPITDEELARGAMFLPHIAKTVELSRPFTLLRHHYNAVLAALDRFNLGVVVVTGTGQIVVENREAARIIDDAGQLCRLSGRLTLKGPESGALAEAITAAAATASGTGRASEHRIAIQGTDDASVLIEVAALRDVDAELERGLSGAVVFLVDTASRNAVSEAGLQTVYSLTDAEADVARLLLNGHAISDIADIRNTSPITARNQVRAILAKTGAARQIDLIRLASLITPPVMPAAGTPGDAC